MGESERSAGTSLDPATARDALTRCRRVVIKIGSKALAAPVVRGEPDPFERLATQVSAFLGRSKGKRRAVIVSSGAIAFGMTKLGLSARPGDMAWLQAGYWMRASFRSSTRTTPSPWKRFGLGTTIS